MEHPERRRHAAAWVGAAIITDRPPMGLPHRTPPTICSNSSIRLHLLARRRAWAAHVTARPPPVVTRSRIMINTTRARHRPARLIRRALRAPPQASPQAPPSCRMDTGRQPRRTRGHSHHPLNHQRRVRRHAAPPPPPPPPPPPLRLRRRRRRSNPARDCTRRSHEPSACDAAGRSRRWRPTVLAPRSPPRRPPPPWYLSSSGATGSRDRSAARPTQQQRRQRRRAEGVERLDRTRFGMCSLPPWCCQLAWQRPLLLLAWTSSSLLRL